MSDTAPKPRKKSTAAGAPTRRRSGTRKPAASTTAAADVKASPAPPTTSTTRGGGRPSNDDRVTNAIMNYTAPIVAVLMIVNPADAHVVAQALPSIARNTTEVLRRYPKVYAAMVSGGDAAPWLNLAMSIGVGLALPLAMNHGKVRIPDQLLPFVNEMRRLSLATDAPLVNTDEPEVEAPAPVVVDAPPPVVTPAS